MDLDWNWNPNIDMFFFLGGHTTIYLGVQWAYHNVPRPRPFKLVESIETFSNSAYSSKSVSAILPSPRTFYTVEMSPNVSYHDSVGDMGVKVIQVTPTPTVESGVAVIPTKTIRGGEANSNNNPSDFYGSIVSDMASTFDDLVHVKAPVNNLPFLLTLLIGIINNIVAEVKSVWRIASILLLQPALMVQGFIFMILLQWFFEGLMRNGIPTHDSLRALPNKLSRYCRQRLRTILLSLLEDDIVVKADHMRLKNEFKIAMNGNQQTLSGFIETLDSFTKQLGEMKTNLDGVQATLATNKSSRTAAHAALCLAIRRYSTYNANMKSAFLEQTARLAEDDLPGHVSALLSYVQSEIVHLTVQMPRAGPNNMGSPGGFGGRGGPGMMGGGPVGPGFMRR